jgi:hypothetical protein
MKRLASLVALAGMCVPAAAEVSDDLKFCGSLKSGAERLACYNAAARIASRPTGAAPRSSVRLAPADAQAAIPTKAAPLEPLPARNQFDGYYAAIGGGYGVGSGRDTVFIQGPLTRATGAITTTQGPNASIVAGRNIAIGWGIVGVEVDARWSDEKGGFATNSFGNTFNLVTPGWSSYSYQNDAAFHASLRVGATFDDLLIFAKAGVGATRVTETFSVDERNAQFCLAFDFSGCAVLSPAGSIWSTKTTSWLPAAIIGVGVEKNWGPVFARFSADLEAFNHSITQVSGQQPVSGSSTATQLMWTTRGTAMIGVRF